MMFVPSLKRLKTKLCIIVPLLVVFIFILVMQGDSSNSSLQEELRRNIWLARGFISRLDGRDLSSSNAHKPFSYKVYGPDCESLLKGDPVEVKVTKEMLFKEYHVTVPDTYFSRETQNCTKFKLDRGYPGKPYSSEETQFRIAYIINVKQSAEQFEHLLHAIYAPQNVYCIHIQRQADEDFHDAIQYITKCFNNAFITSKLENVVDDGYSRLKADMHCVRDLWNSDIPWTYVINLDGLDYPLKTNREIVHHLKALNGLNDIHGIVPKKQSQVDQYQFVYQTQFQGNKGKLVRTGTAKIPLKNPAIRNLYMGSVSFVASRAFITYVMSDPVPRTLYQWLNDTYAPATIFWATANRIPKAPGGSHVESKISRTHAVKSAQDSPPCQGLFVNNQCTYGVGDLRWLTQQHQLFAKQFDIGYDHIALQCLSTRLQERLRNELDQWSKTAGKRASFHQTSGRRGFTLARKKL